MIVKESIPWRKGIALLGLLVSLFLLRLWGAQFCPGDPAFRRWLLQAANGNDCIVIGRVCSAPELRSRATVSLPIEIRSVKSMCEDRWQPVSGERLELRVYTRGRGTNVGDIARDIPALVGSEAYGYEVQARIHRRLPGSSPARPVRLRAHWKAVQIVATSAGHPVMEALLAVKSRLLRLYRELPDPVYRLAAGAILGDRGPTRTGNYGGRRIVELFARAGIGHVLAVSGLHVGILAAGLGMALRRLAVPKRRRVLPMVLVLSAYTALTGARPATVRATLMAVAVMVAGAFGRGRAVRSVWIGLFASAAVLLTWQPLLLLDAGFQLSYAAVVSLLLLTRPTQQALQGLHGAGLAACIAGLVMTALAIARYPRAVWCIHGMLGLLVGWRFLLWAAKALQERFPIPGCPAFANLPRPVRSLVAAQFAVQLGTVIPLGSLYFGRVSIAGTVVNLFAIPLIAVFVQAGILTGILGTIPGLGPVLAWGPKWVTIGTGLLFFRVAECGSRLLPCPVVSRPSLLTCCTWYAALAILFFGRRLQQCFVAGERTASEHGPKKEKRT